MWALIRGAVSWRFLKLLILLFSHLQQRKLLALLSIAGPHKEPVSSAHLHFEDTLKD